MASNSLWSQSAAAYRAQHDRAVEDALSAAVNEMIGSHAPDPTAFLARQLAAEVGLVEAGPRVGTTAEAEGREVSLIAAGKALSGAVVAMCATQPSNPLSFLARHLASAAGIHFEATDPEGTVEAAGSVEAERNERPASQSASSWADGRADTDDARQVAANVYKQPESLVGAVRAGDVLLVRGTWILQRAGYEPVEVEEQACFSSGKIPLTHYEKRREAVALPNRQQIEAEHPAAALPAEELEALHAALRATAAMKDVIFGHVALRATAAMKPAILGGSSAAEDGFDAMPIVSASQCWYTRDHPDPDAKTLATVAERLASLLPQMQRWGVGEVGVFFDWPSLYQNKPTERTPAQAECFKRALDNMSLW